MNSRASPALVKEGKKLMQETRAWDSDVGITRPMRTKETEEDYGYIFEPDLVVTDLTKDWVEKIRDTLPELAQEKTKRFIKDYQLKKDDATIISAQIELAELYEKVAAKVDPVLAAKWLRRELARVMNYSDLDFADLLIDETHLIELLDLLDKKEITENVAQKLLEKLVDKPFDVKAYVEKEGLKTIADDSQLENICKKAIDDSSQAVKEYKAGQEKALNFIIGKVMKATKGTASPKEVRNVIIRMLQ